MNIFIPRQTEVHIKRPYSYRMIDSPHQHAQHGVTRSENLHFLLNKVFLLRLPFWRQSVQMVGGSTGRRHFQAGIRVSVCGQAFCCLCM